MSTGDMGPLDLTSPVFHVAALLDRAAPAALSVEELAAGYVHPNPSDLSRVKNHEGLRSDAEAIRWLIRRAVGELRHAGKTGRSEQQLTGDNGAVALASGKTIEDLRWRGRKVYAVRDVHKVLGDPFNPMSGRYSENVRKNTGKDDLGDLRASMREAGWLPGHPAIRDKRTKVVLTGHRRLQVAAELGIKPEIMDIDFAGLHGEGDPADLARMDVAKLSNFGFRKLTPDERTEIAEYLRETRGMTQAEIAAGLGVSQGTVSNDLNRRSTIKTNNDHERQGDTDSAQAEIRRRVQADEPVRRQEIAARHGVSEIFVRETVAAELALQDAAAPVPEPEAPAPVPEAAVAGHVHEWACSACGQPFSVSP